MASAENNRAATPAYSPRALEYENPRTARIESEPAALGSALIGGLFLFVPFMTGILAVCCALACLCSSTPLRPIDHVLAWIGFGFGALNLIGSTALILAVHL
jgi:hypothetical protein